MKKEEEIRRVPGPQRLSSYFRLEAGTLAVISVSGILYNAGMVAGPWFEGRLAQCLADIIGGKKEFSDMLILALLYVAVILSVQTMRFIKRLYVRRFANHVNRDMKHVLYRNLVHKSKKELEQESEGALMTRAIQDVDACVEGMRKFTTEVFDTGVVMIAYLTMLLWYDWRLTLLACLFSPIACYLAEKLKKAVSESTAAARESAGRLSGATLDRVDNALTYRIFGREEDRNQAYEKFLTDYERKAVRANLWENAMQPVYRIISMTGVIFILWFGAKNVLGSGWSVWNIAVFTTYLSCFTKLAVKASKTAKLFNAVHKAGVSWKRIRPLMKEIPEEEKRPVQPAGVLEAESLSFSYPDSNGGSGCGDGGRILKDISFTARPGEIIGITGPVACGKTTLGRVFLCENPYEGSIRFDGQELAAADDRERGGFFGYMGHQPELMSGTIRENICLGETGNGQEERLWECLRDVCMDRETEAMAQGADTRIGNGGAQLSGGQQARIALARTLFHSRPVLILDDPFSAVDRKTEKAIMTALRRRAEGRIILLISHRLENFAQTDQVIWLENGKAEVSTHQALLEKRGEYFRLYTALRTGTDEEKREERRA